MNSILTRRMPVFALTAIFLLTGQALAQEKKDFPKAAKLLDDYVKLTGGKDAYDKVKTMVLKGTFAAGAINGDMAIYIKSPDLFYMNLLIPGLGKMEAGSDGKVKWENNPITGPKISKDVDNNAVFPGLDTGSDVDWRKVYKSADTMGVEKAGGKELYHVKLVTKKKGEVEHRYFDKATGLVTKMKRAMNSAQGNFMIEVNLDDYRKVGDLLFPHRYDLPLLGQNISMQLKNVEINPKIDESKFALPEGVKALLKKQEDSKDNGN